MKQLTAIFLMGLCLFNLIGYRALFFYAQQRSDAAFQINLDNKNYNEAHLITLKVDLDMPYQMQETSFERVDGQIEVEGKIYKYVKRKVSNGQLVLQCLADPVSNKLESARETFFKISNAVAQDKNTKGASPKSFFAKQVLSEFDQQLSSITCSHFSSLNSYTFDANSPQLLTAVCQLPEQPPEQA
ncbi:MAG TPA: hypothetical protein VM101_10230 [Flavitalea sp.]|nr:hypothetical protein [Flavitalea sp.]